MTRISDDIDSLGRAESVLRGDVAHAVVQLPNVKREVRMQSLLYNLPSYDSQT